MKTAVCGVWHVHAEYYFTKAAALTEVVGIWDENEQMKTEFSQRQGVKAFGSFEELLESDAESVIVCAATSHHADLLVRLAEAGKNIFVEKVLALSDADCERVAEAIAQKGVKFVISLPQKYAPGPRTVKSIVDSGELGKINYMRFRNCHDGSISNWLPDHFYCAEETGGGAMMDLGAHGMYLVDWLCGMPEKFTSVFTTACTNRETALRNTDRVEDNAVTVMEYPDGCIAINETGFVSKGFPITLEIGGETGYVRYDNTGVHKSTVNTDYKNVEVPMLKSLDTPLIQFLTGPILEGCGIEDAKHLTHMMVEAYQNKH